MDTTLEPLEPPVEDEEVVELVLLELPLVVAVKFSTLIGPEESERTKREIRGREGGDQIKNWRERRG